MIARCDELGIECGFLLPLVGPETHLPQSSEEIIAACERSGGHLLPFGNMDLRGISNSRDAPLDLGLRWYTERGAIDRATILLEVPFCNNRNLKRAGVDMLLPRGSAPVRWEFSRAAGSIQGRRRAPPRWRRAPAVAIEAGDDRHAGSASWAGHGVQLVDLGQQPLLSLSAGKRVELVILRGIKKRGI